MLQHEVIRNCRGVIGTTTWSNKKVSWSNKKVSWSNKKVSWSNKKLS
jgi:hypothetical protein